MTATTPSSTQPRIGRLRRYRLLQPVRFYTWPALAFLTLGLVLEAGTAGEWAGFLLIELPALLLLGFALEAARRSTLTAADVLRAMRESQQ